MLTCLHIIYTAFHGEKKAELNSFDKDCMTPEAYNIYYQGFYRKILPISVLITDNSLWPFSYFLTPPNFTLPALG